MYANSQAYQRDPPYFEELRALLLESLSSKLIHSGAENHPKSFIFYSEKVKQEAQLYEGLKVFKPDWKLELFLGALFKVAARIA